MKYRTLFEQATDSIYLIELNQDRFPTRFLEVNPVVYERLEYSREEILSRSPFDINPQVSEVMLRIAKEISRGKRYFTLQNEYVFLKTGKTMYVEISIRVFFNLGEKKRFSWLSLGIYWPKVFIHFLLRIPELTQRQLNFR
ncbi:hypothetical protein GCM10020331_001130 [Ectobacillus funiculus]